MFILNVHFGAGAIAAMTVGWSGAIFGPPHSMGRPDNMWDSAAMENFFSSLKTERTGNKTYRTRDKARADVFDYIECFYNSKRRHSTIGYLSPMECERRAGVADRVLSKPGAGQTDIAHSKLSLPHLAILEPTPCRASGFKCV